MTTPNQNELTFYVNKQLDDIDYKNNWLQVLAWITDGTYDLTIQSLTVDTIEVLNAFAFSGDFDTTGDVTCNSVTTLEVKAQDANGLGLYNTSGDGMLVKADGDIAFDKNILFVTDTYRVTFWNYIEPVGKIHTFAGDPPVGYHLLYCDGSAVSRTTYADLFTAIGVTHGQGNGTTTFNLPDYRGRFLRGVDGAAGNDPDAAGRTAMNTGGATGDNIGSVQLDSYQGHRHAPLGANFMSGESSSKSLANNGTQYQTYSSTGDSITDGTNGTPRIGLETRGKNAYVKYYIKY